MSDAEGLRRLHRLLSLCFAFFVGNFPSLRVFRGKISGFAFPGTNALVTAVLRRLLAFTLALAAPIAHAQQIYFNDFNGPPGSKYAEWTSSPITYTSTTQPLKSGTLPAPVVTNCVSPKGEQKFLGEFGGPPVAAKGEPAYMRMRVDHTITLTLTNLPPHRSLKASFDLLILKSWDGNSPAYGPDRWRCAVADGPVLLDTTFSNNPKVNTEGSSQDYPKPGSPPRTSAVSINTLGYAFFADSIYHMEFTFPHSESNLRLDFSSSLFEGKGTDDESWGLDNVRIIAALP